MKKILIKIVFLLCILSLYQIYAITIESFGVDGSSENINVVVIDRNPLIHWKYTGTVTKYEVVMSTFMSGLSSGTTIWFVEGTTTTINTLNFITRIECNYSNFNNNDTYYLKLKLYSSSTTFVEEKFQFKTSPTAIKQLTTNKLEFYIDQNNPFCPKQNETTTLRYIVKDKDLNVKLYVFTISGKYIRKLVDHSALKDVLYSQVWDGKDDSGNILPEGMYIAIVVAGDYVPVSKFIGIIDKR